MATKQVKYDIGDRVTYDNKIHGIVTALFIRGPLTQYEFSYLDNNGNPTNAICAECELKTDEEPKLGF